MQVITVSGSAGCGKNYFSNAVADTLREYGQRVIEIAYADALKYLLKQYYHWDGNKDVEGRTLLQTVGTEIVRASDENFWVDFVARFLRALDKANEFDVAIISDARFPNEISRLKKFMGKKNVTTVRISRYEERGGKLIPYFNDSLSPDQIRHSSETSLTDYNFDWELVNCGNINFLRETEEWTKDFLRGELSND